MSIEKQQSNIKLLRTVGMTSGNYMALELLKTIFFLVPSTLLAYFCACPLLYLIKSILIQEDT